MTTLGDTPVEGVVCRLIALLLAQGRINQEQVDWIVEHDGEWKLSIKKEKP